MQTEPYLGIAEFAKKHNSHGRNTTGITCCSWRHGKWTSNSHLIRASGENFESWIGRHAGLLGIRHQYISVPWRSRRSRPCQHCCCAENGTSFLSLQLLILQVTGGSYCTQQGPGHDIVQRQVGCRATFDDGTMRLISSDGTEPQRTTQQSTVIRSNWSAAGPTSTDTAPWVPNKTKVPLTDIGKRDMDGSDPCFQSLVKNVQRNSPRHHQQEKSQIELDRQDESPYTLRFSQKALSNSKAAPTASFCMGVIWKSVAMAERFGAARFWSACRNIAVTKSNTKVTCKAQNLCPLLNSQKRTEQIHLSIQPLRL